MPAQLLTGAQPTRTCTRPRPPGRPRAGAGHVGASHEGRGSASTAAHREGQPASGSVRLPRVNGTEQRGSRGAAAAGRRAAPPLPPAVPGRAEERRGEVRRGSRRAPRAGPGRAAPPAPPQHCRHRGRGGAAGRGGALKGPGRAPLSPAPPARG